MTTSFLLHLIIILIVCGILYLIGSWVIIQLGLGEPWPKILMLLIVLVIIVAIVAPLLTGVSLWPLRSGVG